MSYLNQNTDSEAEGVHPLESDSVLLCPHCMVALGQRWYQLRFVAACHHCPYEWDTIHGKELIR